MACHCSSTTAPHFKQRQAGAQVNETIGRTPTPAESHVVEEQWPANSFNHTTGIILHTVAL